MDFFDTFSAYPVDHIAFEKKEQDDDKSQKDSLRKEAKKHSEAAEYMYVYPLVTLSLNRLVNGHNHHYQEITQLNYIS
jgi:hypothetical protein